MSAETDKFKNSKRRLNDDTAVKKQTKIAKSNGASKKVLDQPHRLAKHHAMDCGNPGCVMCGNPRRTWNELTIQEKRKFQEVEIIRDRHSNGIQPDEENPV